ncbi:MAG: PEP-utilizing enzyme [Acidimicrobiales bacterium]
MSSQDVARDRAVRRRVRPLDVADPPGAEGWRDLYGYALPFGAERREYEESAFWFRETVHWTRPLRPFEAAVLHDVMTALGQFNHRHYTIPAARGIDVRILHGYPYLSPGAIDDVAVVEERADSFAERAGHYYAHWDELYAGWMERIRELIGRLDALEVPSLPDVMPTSEVLEGHGTGRVWQVTHAFHTLLDLVTELWQSHFEFLGLGYAAYLDLFAFCRSVSSAVSELELARMVAGIDVDLFRPDHELRSLARAAIELGVDDVLVDTPVGEVIDVMRTTDAGRRWVAQLDVAKEPWFNYSTGSGFYVDDPIWADRLEYPLGFVRHYVEQLRSGARIDVPTETVLHERELIADRVRVGLGAADRCRFDEKLALARTVFHFVENHNFYVEHWGMTLVWRRFRELSALFVDAGFWPRPDDLFLLRPDEVEQAMRDLLSSWATGGPALGPRRWPAEIRRREAILAACARSTPPAVLGEPPAIVTEPFTVMLWGLTAESLRQWASDLDDRQISGCPASPGVVEGRVRVVRRVDDLEAVEDGEILVAELTAPSWAPVFASIAGTITESGGMMSHTAIVCREYGLPAVTGAVWATQRLRTGQRVRLDGSAGTVTVLD